MKWEMRRLDELGVVARGKSMHRPRNYPSLYGGRYPFIQTAQVKAANMYITEYKQTYNERGLAQSKLWDSGTLCITIAANIADTAILTFPACFPDSIIGFVPFEDIADTRYIKYCFDTMQKNFKQISQGATQDNLSLEKLATIKFPIPPLETQKRIADILSTYDNLIENIQKQINLLEESAMRLYKEWFVNLHFPGYETTKIIEGKPEGWKHGKLKNYIDVNSRSVYKTYPYDVIKYIDISSVNHGRIERQTTFKLSEAPGRAKRLTKDGDVIWGMVRPNLKAYALILSPEENCIFSTGFAILSPKHVPYTFLYCSVTRESFVSYLINCTNGSAYPAVKPVHFEEAEIIVPVDTLLSQFHNITDPIFRKIKTIEKQNYYLKQARDKVIAKLINGEIEV